MSTNEEALHDVRRKIAEVMKTQDAKIVVGSTPVSVHANRKEGEFWFDHNGKKWTKKDGLIQSISKLDGAKTPWFCPKCKNSMSTAVDIKIWRRYSMCHVCWAKEETRMKATGEWADYDRRSSIANYKSMLRDKIAELQDYHDNVSAPEMIHADNEKILMIERWGIDLDTVRKDLLEEISKLKEVLTKVEAGEIE